MQLSCKFEIDFQIETKTKLWRNIFTNRLNVQNPMNKKLFFKGGGDFFIKVQLIYNVSGILKVISYICVHIHT